MLQLKCCPRRFSSCVGRNCWRPAGPTVVNPGEDLGYDIYAAEPVLLLPGRVVRVRNGIAIEFDPAPGALVREPVRHGFEGHLLRWRSDRRRVRGETLGCMTLDTNAPPRKENNAVVGTRSRRATRSRSSYLCFQTPCSPLEEAEVLRPSSRRANGFGSSGR